jgi:hypothetical protein
MTLAPSAPSLPSTLPSASIRRRLPAPAASTASRTDICTSAASRPSRPRASIVRRSGVGSVTRMSSGTESAIGPTF